MPEYIERSKLMDHIELNAREHEESYDAWQILGDVEDFPAADVVEVVRCKDCKHFDRHFCDIRKDSWGADLKVGLSDFCSFGERSGEDGTEN